MQMKGSWVSRKACTWSEINTNTVGQHRPVAGAPVKAVGEVGISLDRKAQWEQVVCSLTEWDVALCWKSAWCGSSRKAKLR
jgi:hypothetical protein